MDLEVGDRVALFAAETYAEFTLAPRKSLAKIPTRISTKDAAATFLQGMTAAYLVTDCYPVKPSDFVLLPVSPQTMAKRFC